MGAQPSKFKIELTGYVNSGIMKTLPIDIGAGNKDGICKLVDIDYAVDSLNLSNGKYVITVTIEKKQ